MDKHFLSCDWGTSLFRLRLVNIAEQGIVLEVISKEGIANAFRAWKVEHEISGITQQEYMLSILRVQLDILAGKLKAPIAGIPIVISGMASSSMGIRELPYVGVPFSLDASDAATVSIQSENSLPHEIILVSGVCTKNDLMRGEETQMIGLSGLHANGFHDEVICIFPGTHSKHIKVQEGKIIDFKTYITGELFDLLLNYSVLKEAAYFPGTPVNGACKNAFAKGLEDTVINNLLHAMFLVRVNDLCKRFTKEENYYYLSGLIIGSELKDIQENAKHVQLCSSGNLYPLYQLAIEKMNLAGRASVVSPEIIDKSVVFGQIKILRQFYGQ